MPSGRRLRSRPGTRILLRPLEPAGHADAALARRASDDLAIALGRRRDLVLLSPEADAAQTCT